MRIDKDSSSWESAPWHVKVSAFGIKSVDGIRLWRNISFIAALVGILLSLFSSITGLFPFLLAAFYLSPLGLSACMYWFALDWFRENPDSLCSTNA